jgi:hypothetical protein
MIKKQARIAKQLNCEYISSVLSKSMKVRAMQQCEKNKKGIRSKTKSVTRNAKRSIQKILVQIMQLLHPFYHPHMLTTLPDIHQYHNTCYPSNRTGIIENLARDNEIYHAISLFPIPISC